MVKDAKGLDKQWVILSELINELFKRDVYVPEDVLNRLRIAYTKLSYYLLDEHATLETLRDVEIDLNYIQSKLFPLCEESLFNEFLDKLSKALTGELNVEFPLDRKFFNKEVRKRGKVESVRVKLMKYIDDDRLIDLGEWHGVIFEYSSEDDLKVIIEGEKKRVIKALKEFSIMWKSD